RPAGSTARNCEAAFAGSPRTRRNTASCGLDERAMPATYERPLTIYGAMRRAGPTESVAHCVLTGRAYRLPYREIEHAACEVHCVHQTGLRVIDENRLAVATLNV